MKRRIALVTIICLALVSSLFVFGTGRVFAATTYYAVLVTGNNNWSSSTTWSINSNGIPTGAGVPGQGDTVYPSTLIAPSATLTVDINPQKVSVMDWTANGNTTAFTFTIANSTILDFYGNVTFLGGMTVNGAGFLMDLATSGTQIFTTNGVTIGCGCVSTQAIGGTFRLGDTFYGPNCVINYGLAYGTFDTYNQTVTCSSLTLTNSTNSYLTLGSSVINCSTFAAGTSGHLSAASSTINVSSASTFAGASKTFGIVYLSGAGTYTITGSNTFGALNTNPLVAQTIKLLANGTQNLSACSLSGSSGHVHTLTTSSGTTTWTINYTGAGTITVSYCTISYSIATPSSPNTWFYDGTCTYNSTSGWTAIVPSITNSPTSLDFGTVMPGTTYYAYNQSSSGSYPNPVTSSQCYFTLTNTGSSYCNIALSSTNATGGNTWTLVSSSPTGDQFEVIAVYNTENPTSGLVLTHANQSFYTGLAASATLLWDFKEILGGTGIGKAGTFSDSATKTYTVTITGS